MKQQFTFSERLGRMHLRALASLGEMVAQECLSPPASAHVDAKAHKFSLLLFSCGAGGLFYRLSAEHLGSLGAVRGKPASELISRYASGSPSDAALAMATMNAVASRVFSAAGFSPAQASKATDPTDGKTGLVGFFPPLVRRAREMGKTMLVLEMNPAFQSEADDMIEIISDPCRLAECDRIFCTAATLLNHSLPQLLEHKRSPTTPFELIGPTGGCLPGEIFELGVTAVGGSSIHDPVALGERLVQDKPWADLTHKIRITASEYPGDEVLIHRAAERLGA